MKTSYELSLTESEMCFLMNLISEYIIQALMRIDFVPETTLTMKQQLESSLGKAKSIAEKLEKATE